MRPGDRVELGAAVCAYASLRPDEETASRIASLLGYDVAQSRPQPPARTVAPPQPAGDQTLPIGTRRGVSRPDGPNAPTTTDSQSTEQTVRTRPWRRFLRPVRQTTLTRRGGDQGLPAASVVPTPPPPLQPLLSPPTAPRLLEALVATDAKDGDIDVDLVVAALATRRRIVTLPRESRPSLLRGVQVLTDVSVAMAPYFEDADEVRSVLRASVGAARVTELNFDGTPTAGAGTGSVWSWGPYQPPSPGTPVVALTELGLAAVPGRFATEMHDSWIDLSSTLARRGSPLIVLTPFQQSRWPARLVDTVEIVHWDRTCSVSVARRLLGRRSVEDTEPW